MPVIPMSTPFLVDKCFETNYNLYNQLTKDAWVAVVSYLPTVKALRKHLKMVYFLIGHYTYRMFPPAIDYIPTSLAVVYSNKN